MAISSITAFQSSKRRPSSSAEVVGVGGDRRTSIQGNLNNLSKQVTQGLGLKQFKGQSEVILKGCIVRKSALQEGLSKSLGQPQLKVVRLESHPEKVGSRAQVEVLLKLPESRKKILLEMSLVSHGADLVSHGGDLVSHDGDLDHQAQVLLGPVSCISGSLEEVFKKQVTGAQYLPLPRFFKIEASPEDEEREQRGEKSKLETTPKVVLAIEKPGPSGFLSLSQGALADYEHSALTITSLARLHI